MALITFAQKLQMCDSEKLVESTYHQELLKFYPMPTHLKTGCRTDGILESEVDFNNQKYILKIIVEAKYKKSFNSPESKAQVLAQVVYYLKKFELAGDRIPNIILVGSKSECFVLHSNDLLKYLDLPYDWTIAPSNAASLNPLLFQALCEDADIQSQCYVFLIDTHFKFDVVYKQIETLVTQTKTLIRLTPQSFSKVFDYFSLRILKKDGRGKSKYSPRQQVELFMQLILKPLDCYSHPNKPYLAIFGEHRNISVNPSEFSAFMHYYTFDYPISYQKSFTAICDRLIKDSERRYRGDFYTPSIWADEAHKLLSDHLGINWKSEYVIWDCAWGTGNLTRDYHFNHLFCSTLEQHDLHIGNLYNPSAIKFKYDFLNEDVSLFETLLQKVRSGSSLTLTDFQGSNLYKLAPTLIEHLLSGCHLLFFINPPYKTNAELKNKLSGTKTASGVANTQMNALMLKEQMGRCSQQLYAQFLYRIILFAELFKPNLTTVSLGLFAPPGFITSSYFSSFRKSFESNFSYTSGILFQASNFADVSSNWGITFTLFTPNTTSIPLPYVVRVKEMNESGVYTLYEKTLYNLDYTLSCSDWIKADIKKLKGEDAPQMTSALNYHTTPKDGKLLKDALGFYYNQSNIVDENTMNVCLYTSCASHGHGISILPINFMRIVSNFTARRLISGSYATWINAKDEYQVPNTQHPLYARWESDCIVYSLFNTASQQSSLRHIHYNHQDWNIFNHFFFLSNEDMRQLALGNLNIADTNTDIYQDLMSFGQADRYVYTLLQTYTLSPDAKAVLDYARTLTFETFKHRKAYHEMFPEHHLNTWDAGWYQIKLLLKQYDPSSLKTFNLLYTALEDRMRPLVYELGFLYL